MARIQILELPDEEGDDGKTITPFALIIDQCSHDQIDLFLETMAEFRKDCGARAGYATTGTLDIPRLTPEELAAYGPRSHVGTAAIEIVPDFTGFESAIRETVEAIGPQKIGVYVGEDEVTGGSQPDALTEFVNGFRKAVATFVASAAKDEDGRG